MEIRVKEGDIGLNLRFYSIFLFERYRLRSANRTTTDIRTSKDLWWTKKGLTQNIINFIRREKLKNFQKSIWLYFHFLFYRLRTKSYTKFYSEEFGRKTDLKWKYLWNYWFLLGLVKGIYIDLWACSFMSFFVVLLVTYYTLTTGKLN